MMDDETTRRRIIALLGGTVGTRKFEKPTLVAQSKIVDGLLDDLIFRTDEGTEVPGYFLKPMTPNGAAILYCHAHGDRYDIGRQEILDGRKALQSAYAPDLLAAGFSVLCLEMPCFGSRQIPNESALSKAHFWRGTTLFGEMLAELTCGIDFLCEQPTLDATRIAAMGISMGSTHAWWLAALDTRLRAAVAQCSFADIAELVGQGAHDGHGAYMTVPGLLGEISTGALAGLAAPRALLICAGLRDWSTPEHSFSTARKDLQAAYDAAGAAGNLEFCVDAKSGHEETPQMRARTMAFLLRHL